MHQDPGSILDGMFYSGTLFFATYLSQGLHFNNAYWLVVSCAAILMGDNLRAMAHRHVQRILGTVVGLLITALIFNIHLSSVGMLLMIPILFMVIEYLIMKNYAVATFFTTPMALMLTTLARQPYSGSLLADRMLGIVIGSVLGVLAGWIFTVGIEFYNKEFHLHQNLEKEGD
ncbi:FUSC family protein [Enterococcus bulliens]